MHRSVIPPGDALARARMAQAAWGRLSVGERLRPLATLRALVGAEAASLAASVGRASTADTLVAEVLPLAEACAFLVRRAERILRPRRLQSGRPTWLFGVRASVLREPLGVVLVIGPGNYPLFLPGAQALQALAAGNAVAVKPAPGGEGPMHALAGLLRRAGLPDGLFQVLDSSARTGAEAAAAGFDHLLLTGSAETGRKVLAGTAQTLTPTTMELSGSDAVLVLPGAELSLVARAVAYGLRLNDGATCIAPRRVFVPRGDAAALEAELLRKLREVPPAQVPPPVLDRLRAALSDAERDGARILSRPDGESCPPVLVADAHAGMRLLREDLFAPWTALVPVADTDAMLAEAARCPYALGASVWGPEEAAVRLAGRVRAGSVCVNDLIVPTADPRLPFGGRGRSGFGATRGAEGLLAMTAPKAVSVRRGRFRPHLQPPRPDDARRFAALIAMLHGPWSAKAAALRALAARP